MPDARPTEGSIMTPVNATRCGDVGSTPCSALRRTLRRWTVLGVVCVAGCIAENDDTRQVQRVEAAAASRGLAYAEETCAGCHAVTPGEAFSPNPLAPTFESVANTPGMTLIAFNAWMQTAHPTMPNLIVGPDRIEDLWAYMSTLKTNE
jgi:mono/diheme cytochrome c family protein